jgi:hypothetical protein
LSHHGYVASFEANSNEAFVVNLWAFFDFLNESVIKRKWVILKCSEDFTRS